VSIVNTSDSRGKAGSISFSGNGTWNLTPMSSGSLAGVTIFQPRANSNAVSISGNAIAGIAGTIYAPSALVSVTGNGQLSEAIDADKVRLTGNGQLIDKGLVGGTGYPISATEGVNTGNITVAKFYGTIANGVNSNTTALIDWGNGYVTDGTISADPSGGYDVVGNVTYGEEGTYTITVNLVVQGVVTSTVSSTATVADAVLTAGALTPPVASEAQALSNATVFHFTDADTVATIGDYTALVTLGDGNTVTLSATPSSNGQIVANPNGGFDVQLSHTYAEELSNVTFGVTVTDNEGGSGTGTRGIASASTTTFSVADAALNAGALTPPVATESQPFTNQTVFHFTDTDPNASVSDYSALVTLGDGNTVTLSATPSSNGQIVANPNGGFDVQLSHTYAEELSNVTFGVSVTDHNATVHPSPATFSVTDAALSSAPANLTPPSATEGVPTGSVVLFHFTDADPNGALGDYAATVNWGDGTSNTSADGSGTVSVVAASGGGFNVLGNHKYAEELTNATFSVTVADHGASTGQNVATFKVNEVPVPMTGGFTITAKAGLPFTNQTVARFTDPAGAEATTNPSSEYPATINWGDGSAASAGTIGYDSSTGNYTIQAGHTYSTSGSRVITVTVVHGGVTSTATSNALVGAPNHPPHFTSDPLAGREGQAYPVDLSTTTPGQNRILEIVAKNNNQLAYPATGVDPDGDSISFSMLEGPAGMQINPTTGMLTWTPPAAAGGTYSVRLRVTDQFGLYDPAADQVFSVRVRANVPDRPPQFTTDPVVFAYVGKSYAYPSHAFDPDGDTLTYSYVPDADPTKNPGGNFGIVTASGAVSWTPTADQVGKTYSVKLTVVDPSGLGDVQDYQIIVMQDPANHPPVIISKPPTAYNGPGTGNPASGNVSPSGISLALANGQQQSQTVSLTLPSGSQVTSVDVFLLFDDTGSFHTTASSLQQAFPQVISQLTSSFPNISFGFGVGRFDDFGQLSTAPNDHPFYLNQPIITTNAVDTAHNITFNDAIQAALQRNGNGNGGDTPESDIEALYQVATGRGFAGTDGTTAGAGPAGSATAQSGADTTDDVPAFSTYQADPSLAELPAAGTLGGVGFRQGALPIILLATDAGIVFQPDPSGSSTITGAGGVQVPLSQFQGNLAVGNLDRETTPGGQGATIQQTVNALNGLGALVIVLGANDNYPLHANCDPRQWLDAMAQLTGAINGSNTPIDSGIPNDGGIGNVQIQKNDPIFFGLNAAGGDSGFTLPNAITNAVTAAVTSVRYNLDVVPSDPTVQLVNNTGVVENIAAGGTATFNVTFTGDIASHTFDLTFVRAGTGDVLGSIPVRMDSMYYYPVKAIDPDGDPITYGMTGNTNGASINPTTGLMTWHPATPGTYSFTVTAADGRGGEDQQPFQVVVTNGANSNNVLTFTSMPPTTAAVGSAFAYQPTVQETTAGGAPSTAPLYYYLLTGPSGSLGDMTIDRFTGALTWTPAAAVADQTVTIEVTDGQGATK
ncbi:MAG: hypothetical protein JWL97_3469, partial [Gemmatimonadales bacterium]|nr:hypothetical protein [Gemmatimonadales bacterium]